MTTHPALASTVEPPAAAHDGLMPIPPRYWWLKRIGLAVSVLIVALAGLRWYWGVVAEQRWRAAVAALEATGEPLYAKDFVEPAVPDEENAAYFLMAAAAAMRELEVDAPETIPPFEYMAESSAWLSRSTLMDILLQRNRESLDLVRRARRASRTNWAISRHRDYSQLRSQSDTEAALSDLAGLTYFSARLNAYRGDQREALEDVRDLLHQGWAADRQPRIMGRQRGSRITEYAVWAVGGLAPTLVIDGIQNVTMTRIELQGLIRNLLDEQALRESLRWALCHFRAEELEWLRKDLEPGARKQTVHDSVRVWALAPGLKLEASAIVRSMSPLGQIEKTERALAAWRRSLFDPDAADWFMERARFLIEATSMESRAISAQYFDNMAQRRLAATRLAIRLYEIDHVRMPETLRELVPEYLPTVPIDPLFDGAREIGYEPHGPGAALFAGAPREYENELTRSQGKQLTGVARYPVSMRLDGKRTATR